MNDQEKNEAIARKLGWKQVSSGKPGHADLWIHPTNEGASEWDALPYYHSIEAAWEICDWLTKENYTWTLSYVTMFGKIYSFVIHKVVDQLANEQADTAPRAICEAFLKLP